MLLQKALEVLGAQHNIARAYQMASAGQEVVVEYRAHKRNGKPQIGLLTPDEAIRKAEAIAPEALTAKEAPAADKVEPSEPGPTPATKLRLDSHISGWLANEGYTTVEEIAVDMHEGVLPAMVPGPSFTASIVTALGNWDRALISDEILAFGLEALDQFEAQRDAELAQVEAEEEILAEEAEADAELDKAEEEFIEEMTPRPADSVTDHPRHNGKPTEGPDEIDCGVDPGQFHGSNGAATKRHDWVNSLVPVARFKANGEAFFRTMETGNAAEVAALTDAIAVQWPTMKLTVMKTVRIRWEPQYATV